jgi:hypothetical protein
MNKSPLLRFLQTAGVASLCLLFGACASFDPRWRAADGTAKSRYATRWDGRWTSAKHRTPTGKAESGRLRCVLEHAGGGKLDAHFHANFLFFSANYSMTLEPKKGGGKSEFRGTQDLPKIFGGTYSYKARITKDHFVTHYDSSYDNGTFDLRRVKSSAELNSSHSGG